MKQLQQNIGNDWNKGEHWCEIALTFLGNASILYSPKIPENLRFLDVFRGCKVETLTRNGLIIPLSVRSFVLFCNVFQISNSAQVALMIIFRSFITKQTALPRLISFGSSRQKSRATRQATIDPWNTVYCLKVGVKIGSFIKTTRILCLIWNKTIYDLFV